MDDWITKLRTAIKADEEIALNLAGGLPWTEDKGKVFSPTKLVAEVADPNHGWHIARHDPKRVLAMVAAHREILAVHEHQPSSDDKTRLGCVVCNFDTRWGELFWADDGHCATVLALAKGYGIEVEG